MLNNNDAYILMSQPTWENYQIKAQELLDKSDLVAIRCLKAGIAFPADWQSYVSELRGIIDSNSGDATISLPIKPTYPMGS